MIHKVNKSSMAAFERATVPIQPRPKTFPPPVVGLTAKKLLMDMLVLDFYRGYAYFQEFSELTGSMAHADKVFRLIVDYCELDQYRYAANVERIARLPSTNPDEIEGIEELLVRFAVEFYTLMYNKRVFKALEGSKFPYEYVRFAGSRIILQHKKIV